MNDLLTLRVRYWRIVIGIVILIYSTLYIMPFITDFLIRRIPFSLTVNVILWGVIVFVLYRFVRFSQRLKRSTYMLLAINLSLYLAVMLWKKIPAERFHLFEYGILAVCIFRAMRLDLGEGMSYLWAFLLTFLIGWGDEGIQHLLPNRYYEMADVLLNAVSGALGLTLMFIIRRENEILC